MIRFLAILLAICPLLSHAATVTGLVQNASSSPLTGLIITFTDTNTRPKFIDAPFVSSTNVTARVNTDGSFSKSLVTGGYRVRVGVLTNDTFIICVPDDSATYDWQSLVCSGNITTTTNFALGVVSSIQTNGVTVGSRGKLNLIAGTNVVLEATNNASTGAIDVMVNASGSGGAGGGDVTTAQLVSATNLLYLNLYQTLTNFDQVTSNGLYALISVLPNLAAVTNVSRFFSTNSAIVTSNALWAFLSSSTTALTNLANAYSQANSNLSYAIGANGSNYTLATLVASNKNWIGSSAGSGTNTTLTNATALTPTFYGKVGIGLPSASAATAIELRDGSSDQAFLITRELNTSYSSLGFRTGSSYDWQVGQRSGNSDLWYLNAQTGSYLRQTVNGALWLANYGTFTDNSINVQNVTGGYSSAAFYRPADAGIGGPTTAAAVAFGFGPGQLGSAATPYAGRAYIGLSPSNSVGLPPEFVIGQEQTNSAALAMTHVRQLFSQDGTIRFFNYNDSFNTGTLALAIWPNGNATLGTSTNTTTNSGVLIVQGTLNAVGTITGATVNATSENITGTSTAATYRATSGQITGTHTAAVVTATSANITGTATGATFTATSGNFSGTVTGAMVTADGGNFNALTSVTLRVTGPAIAGGGLSVSNGLINFYDGTTSTANKWAITAVAASGLLVTDPVGNNTLKLLTNDLGRVGVLNLSPTNALDVQGHTSLRSNVWMPQLGSNNAPVAFLGRDAGGRIYDTYIPAIFTNTVLNVLGAGSGSTNYVFTCFTNSINAFICGSSNAHIASISGGVAGAVITFTIDFTNLSSSVWGFTFSAGTNSWLFAGPYGTNAPTVMTNGTRYRLAGELNGSNTVVGWTTLNPAKFP